MGKEGMQEMGGGPGAQGVIQKLGMGVGRGGKSWRGGSRAGEGGEMQEVGRGEMQEVGRGMRGRSPEEPPQEGVRALDPLLGLRHELHGLPLLAGAVHRSRFSCCPFLLSSSSSSAAAPGARRARARGGARAGCGMRDPAGIGDERLLPAGGTRAAAALGLFPERDSFGS